MDDQEDNQECFHLMTNIRFLLYGLVLVSILSSGLVSCDGGDDSGSQNFAQSSAYATQENVESPEVITTSEEPFVDPELEPHLKTFIEEARLRNIPLDAHILDNITIIFAALPTDKAGLCTRWHDGANTIKIATSWRGENTEWVVIHELGHCVLGMVHRNTNLSIMNSPFYVQKLDQANRKSLFDEFFTPAYFDEPF